MKKPMRLLQGILCLSGSTLAAQNSAGDSQPEQKPNLHIYLLIGQSNMAGRAPFTEEEAAHMDRCSLLNGEDQWEPAKNPLNRHSTIRKRMDVQQMGPGYTFAKTLLGEDQDITVGLVVNAQGGTRIEQWQKGTHFYSEAVRRTKKAQQTGTLKGILWHQGESNSGNPATYLEDLTKLIRDLRNEFGDPSLPFVAGQVFYHPEKKPQTKQINDQIMKLPDLVPFTGSVSSENLTTFDNTHFDAQSIKLLGQRYAEEMLKIQANEPKNPPDKK